MKYSLRSLMTFSIRDLFWLTVVVALAVGWWVQSRNSAAELAVTKKHVNLLVFYFEARTHDSVWLRKDGRVDIEERPAVLTSQAPAPNPPNP
jgi:hypothetical protein